MFLLFRLRVAMTTLTVVHTVTSVTYLGSRVSRRTALKFNGLLRCHLSRLLQQLNKVSAQMRNPGVRMVPPAAAAKRTEGGNVVLMKTCVWILLPILFGFTLMGFVLIDFDWLSLMGFD